MHAAAAIHLVDLLRDTLSEPAEPWEVPAADEDVQAHSRLGRAGYADIPMDLASPGVPNGAVADLEAVVGRLTPGRLIVVPRTPRSAGRGGWVVTPASVVGLGADAVALWVDRAGPRVVARIPYAEVAAVSDLTVLLYGRVEIVGPEGSIVLRYNTVGRPSVRAALRAIREAFPEVAMLRGAPAGPDAGTLPYKWARMLEIGDLRPDGPGPRILAAGTLDSKKPLPRTGVAVADAREVAIATQPDKNVGIGTLGVDLVSLPMHGCGPSSPRVTASRPSSRPAAARSACGCPPTGPWRWRPRRRLGPSLAGG